MERTVYVGTYTPPAGQAEGIYRLAFDEDTGLAEVQAVYKGIENPSYLAVTRDGRRLYCVKELEMYQGAKGGAVAAFAIAADVLTPLGERPTCGGAPCHVVLSPDETVLCVSNYTGGSLSAYAIDAEGVLGEAQCIAHTGHGPNPQRQEAPHVHSARFTPSGDAVLVMDLGTDMVTAYPVKGGMVGEEPIGASAAHPGDGPRMSAYDAGRNLLYVLGEMGNNVSTFACDARGIPTRLLWAVSMLPEGAQSIGAADIHLSRDGRFLYASNRGHDSISCFAISDEGMLSMVQNIPCGGRTPRGFTLSPSGRWLLCGNQDSGTVTIFAVDSEKGTLAQHAETAVPTPVCLVFAPEV